ncbi:MAG TPA: N-acetylmuramoyl-L-alanine amidase [Candidatus Sulfomarinibacteraceae bacterium]|nr:N-acetylmuramoyl-L-alanine amidase [Candidatus Sulfomarinibacteraceae bacterium]
MKKWMPLAILLPLLIITYSSMSRGSAAQDEAILMDELWLQGADFRATGPGVLLDETGLALAESIDGATYTSPPLDAPLPFNALVPQWKPAAAAQAAHEEDLEAEPETKAEHDHAHDDSLAFQFRTAKEGRWTEWLDLYASDDMSEPGDEFVFGDMLVVPAEDVTHDQVQFRVRFNRLPDGDSPGLEALRLTFIDATAGPTTEELLAQQEAADLAPQQPADGYPKPPVISRQQWCTDPDCNYSDGLEYYPVSHLILHHTVTTSSGDTAATVRAIWKFHTYTRGWGDIGYNYLVDTNGVIFEGHLGGDDVVGTHAGGANAGSMALSLIGNFVEVTPPTPMMEAAANLFAWKADQKNIDVYDSGYLPHINWGLPKLMGHRDVYGTTQCPGDKAHALLPALRDAVAQRLNFTPPHLYYDEKDPRTNFNRSSDGWQVGPAACGYNVNAYYAWSTTDSNEARAWAEWRPEVAVPGQYELSVYAPYCYTRVRDTNGATYRVTDPHGASTVVVNQEKHLGAWVPLGNFYFEGNGTTIRLTNLTTTDEDWGLWADAIRLRYLEPGALNRSPEPESWRRTRTVSFQWTVSNPASVSRQRLQVARDAIFQKMLLDLYLPAEANGFTHTFSGDEKDLFWRVYVTNTANHTSGSKPTHFGIDTEPPSSRVHGVFRYGDGRLLVGWAGQDAVSGIVGYNIEYRAEGSSAWVLWQANTSATGAFFTPPEPGRIYWFRSQAIDAANNVEAVHGGNGDTHTGLIIALDHDMILPVVRKP